MYDLTQFVVKDKMLEGQSMYLKHVLPMYLHWEPICPPVQECRALLFPARRSFVNKGRHIRGAHRMELHV
jgi:hypothetical protein